MLKTKQWYIRRNRGAQDHTKGQALQKFYLLHSLVHVILWSVLCFGRGVQLCSVGSSFLCFSINNFRHQPNSDAFIALLKLLFYVEPTYDAAVADTIKWWYFVPTIWVLHDAYLQMLDRRFTISLLQLLKHQI